MSPNANPVGSQGLSMPDGKVDNLDKPPPKTEGNTDSIPIEVAIIIQETLG